MLVRVAGHKLTWPDITGKSELMQDFSLPFIPSELLWGDATPLPSGPLNAMLFYLVLPSVFWALLNLMPVYPLDGGQIARELFLIFNARNGIRYSLVLSVITGAGLAALGLYGGQFFMAIMFGMLAFSSYQVLQQYSGRGSGFGGGNPW